MDTIERSVLCKVPDTVDAQLFQDTLQRKVEVYRIQVEPKKIDDEHYRVALSGEKRGVEAAIDGLQMQLGGWGGRVEVEPAGVGVDEVFPTPVRRRHMAL